MLSIAVSDHPWPVGSREFLDQRLYARAERVEIDPQLYRKITRSEVECGIARRLYRVLAGIAGQGESLTEEARPVAGAAGYGQIVAIARRVEPVAVKMVVGLKAGRETGVPGAGSQ